MVLFLVGYMGCGKSTVGRALARELGYSFVDMDTHIEIESGMNISDIFATKGELWFRERERDTIAMFAGGENMIVATGGGVPCYGDNMQRLCDSGLTVYLKMSPEKLLTRLEHGRSKRPLIRELNNDQLLSFITQNLVIREPFYSQSALVIDCNGVSDQYIVHHIEDYVVLLARNK